MNRKRKHTATQYLSFFLYFFFAMCCVAVYTAKLCNCQNLTLLTHATTVFAVVILCYALYTFLFRPIAVDRIISSNRWLFIIAIFLTILTIPISIEFVANKILHKGIIAEELVYDPNVYYEPDADTAHTTTEYQYTCNGDSIIFLTTTNNRFEQRREEMRHRGTDTIQPSSQWAIWYHFVDPGNQHMTTTHRGRMLSMLISLLGTLLLSGILVSILTNLLDRRAQAFTEGTRRYRRIAFRPRGHIIIFGGHHSLIEICKNILEKQPCSIFILTNDDVQSLRSSIVSALGEKAERRIVIYKGSGTDADIIHNLHPEWAQEYYLLGDEAERPDHDVANMNTLQLLLDNEKMQHLANKNVPMRLCYVQFEYQSAFFALQSAMTPGLLNNLLEFIPYNFYENWAQKVLVTHADPTLLTPEGKLQHYNQRRTDPKWQHHYIPLDGKGIGVDSDETVHVIIVGMSKMGIAMAIEAAQIAHYPNYVRDNNLRTRITFIDPEADREKDFFMGRFRHLFDLSRWRYMDGSKPIEDARDRSKGLELTPWNDPTPDYLDIEWEFIKGNVQCHLVQDYLVHCTTKQRKHTIAMCLPNEHESIAATLFLPRQVLEKAQQTLVYQHSDNAMIDTVSGANLYSLGPKEGASDYFAKLRYGNVFPFGMCEDSEMHLSYLRKVGHAATIVYDSIGLEEFARKDIIGFMTDRCEESRKHKRQEWASKMLWEQWSCIYNIATIPTKMRSIAATLPASVASGDPFSSVKEHLHGKQYGILYGEKREAMSAVIRRVKPTVKPQQAEDLQLYMLRLLSEMEHNRWDIEKLLMGYRPLTLDEELTARRSNDDFKAIKNQKNTSKRSQMCLRPFDDLYNWDPGVVDYDIAFILMTPYLNQLIDQLSKQ